ncbi:MAG: hypothetical protein ACRELA_05355, partial [Candidatus Rokuibacteriota bacterium]
MRLPWIAGLLALLLAATGAVAQSTVTTSGDLQAAQEVTAAWERFERLQSYRMRFTTGVWLCPKGPWPYDLQALAAQAGPPPPTEEIYGRLGEVMIEGARTRGYTLE